MAREFLTGVAYFVRRHDARQPVGNYVEARGLWQLGDVVWLMRVIKMATVIVSLFADIFVIIGEIC